MAYHVGKWRFPRSHRCKICRGRQKIWQLLFSSLHQKQKIGESWKNIPNYEKRGLCRACDDADERMEHILLECSAREGPLVWALAGNLWPKDGGPWPEMTISTIIGCGSMRIRPTEDDAGDVDG
ncbi:hypothetical protein JAAARDRAFT_403942 [Jaapia argillacea MUCL 33604]|uniref:Reverse transcriptase zinc-binding domain-containing protein n=1 Tax=Jaapia argillacea MUCL 33604 TaxID=933084 RepID=A0A067PVB8_9AGAM|nr:hypothetical protein JAAARDRAFT_403942 [Jaapia argillacea MUCL 33604]